MSQYHDLNSCFTVWLPSSWLIPNYHLRQALSFFEISLCFQANFGKQKMLKNDLMENKTIKPHLKHQSFLREQCNYQYKLRSLWVYILQQTCWLLFFFRDGPHPPIEINKSNPLPDDLIRDPKSPFYPDWFEIPPQRQNDETMQLPSPSPPPRQGIIYDGNDHLKIIIDEPETIYEDITVFAKSAKIKFPRKKHFTFTKSKPRAKFLPKVLCYFIYELILWFLKIQTYFRK